MATLYWAMFGLVEKDRMDLHRKHSFTMFIGLLMFGVYCCITVVLIKVSVKHFLVQFVQIEGIIDAELAAGGGNGGKGPSVQLIRLCSEKICKNCVHQYS